MSNRKATFAKRNREMELKEHAKNKEARREQRKAGSTGRENKGPEIAWDQAVDQSAVINAAEIASANRTSLVPRDDSSVTAPEPPKPSENVQPHLQQGSPLSSGTSSDSSADSGRNQQN